MRDCSARLVRSWRFLKPDGRSAKKPGLLTPDIVRTFTTNRQGVPNSSWALGWDTPVGAVVVRYAVFSRIVRSSRVHRPGVSMDRPGQGARSGAPLEPRSSHKAE